MMAVRTSWQWVWAGYHGFPIAWPFFYLIFLHLPRSPLTVIFKLSRGGRDKCMQLKLGAPSRTEKESQGQALVSPIRSCLLVSEDGGNPGMQ
jgi:hypothetical protein